MQNFPIQIAKPGTKGDVIIWNGEQLTSSETGYVIGLRLTWTLGQLQMTNCQPGVPTTKDDTTIIQLRLIQRISLELAPTPSVLQILETVWRIRRNNSVSNVKLKVIVFRVATHSRKWKQVTELHSSETTVYVFLVTERNIEPNAASSRKTVRWEDANCGTIFYSTKMNRLQVQPAVQVMSRTQNHQQLTPSPATSLFV